MPSLKTPLAVSLAAMLAASTSSVFAGPSQNLSAASTHASAASTHTAGALANSAIAVGKVAAIVVATPLVVAGASGVASGVAGSALLEYASEPLPIGHKVIHTRPKPTTPNPAQQMAAPEPANNK